MRTRKGIWLAGILVAALFATVVMRLGVTGGTPKTASAAVSTAATQELRGSFSAPLGADVEEQFKKRPPNSYAVLEKGSDGYYHVVEIRKWAGPKHSQAATEEAEQ